MFFSFAEAFVVLRAFFPVVPASSGVTDFLALVPAFPDFTAGSAPEDAFFAPAPAPFPTADFPLELSFSIFFSALAGAFFSTVSVISVPAEALFPGDFASPEERVFFSFAAAFVVLRAFFPVVPASSGDTVFFALVPAFPAFTAGSAPEDAFFVPAPVPFPAADFPLFSGLFFMLSFTVLLKF